MKHRFVGPDGARRVIEALSKHPAVGDRATAELVAARAVVEEHSPGATLIMQDAADNDVYFILSGTAIISVHGREVARRTAGQHVGEMALIDPGAPRSASVIASDTVVVAKVSEPDFDDLARKAPHLWRNLARELCVRLRDRNALVAPKNLRTRVFVGCSGEALTIAREVQSALRHDPFDVVVWTDDVFGASHFPIEDLEQQLSQSDFAVLVISPDDRVTSRSATHDAPRDNVVFELGLFMGAIGHRRTFLLKPDGANIKIPSDLLGLTPLGYNAKAASVALGVAAACNDLRKILNETGPK